MTGSTVKTFDQLVEKIKASEKPYDLEKISQAYKVAEKAHEGQKRTSGDPYITHPLLDYCMDTDTICAALLHDTVEDTDVTLDDLRKKFGEDVALMVDGVTKIGLVPLVSKEEQQAENIRKCSSVQYVEQSMIFVPSLQIRTAYCAAAVSQKYKGAHRFWNQQSIRCNM